MYMRVDCMKRARELFLLLRRCRNVVDEKWQRTGVTGEFAEGAGEGGKEKEREREKEKEKKEKICRANSRAR